MTKISGHIKMQRQKILDLEASLLTFNRICETIIQNYGHVSWGKEPQEVVAELLAVARPSMILEGRYFITYNEASRIMENARTCKLHSLANRGIDHIKQEWRKNYIGEI